MVKRFQEYKNFNLADINNEILEIWTREKTFEKSLEIRKDYTPYIFYEGPPSANGMPGIHHVISRTIKDIFCRYKTMQGFLVERKAGWDTHGLPIELSVESYLGITKEDIGTGKISIAEFNNTCKKEVMKYTREWEDLTRRMGYWVDMESPYITYDNRYIETLWYLLKQLYDKKLLYKGYSIQPYSPAAGTGLSTHELNQPGCYRDVKDTTCVAQFRVIRDDRSEFLFRRTDSDIYFLAWTTTPWTLPSNTALAVGADIVYVKVRSFNPYTYSPITTILAKDLLPVYFSEKNRELDIESYQPGDKQIPFKILEEFKGRQLEGIRYEQLINWVNPGQDAFKVLLGDFVTTEDGTGIVHIAPTFGADDFKVARKYNIPPLLVVDQHHHYSPLVDKKGRFIRIGDLDKEFTEKFVNVVEYLSFSGRYVKNEYDDGLKDEDTTVDIDIAVFLKKENKVFRIEKHVHPYPHCWRTDKPVLYYPMDAWFIKTTAIKDRMIELNDTINWKPESTGKGRFGKWLENLVDWNLSRSRFWGTPLPIWATEDNSEYLCIGSVAELKIEINKSVKAGFMKMNLLEGYTDHDNSAENYGQFDLHRPFVDEIVLVSPGGAKMFREPDLIDVWFDSGAMPYAQIHYMGSSSPALPKREGVKSSPGYQTARASMHGLLKELADQKRKNQTVAEPALWEQLRGKKLENYRFMRQHLIDEFIVDFVCLEKQVIIEVDGGYHNDTELQKADNSRTEILESLGYRVLRFTNDQVIGNIDYVLNRINLSLEALSIGGGLGGAFPADFVAEGVDQTRGWFFTLHAIAAMLFDSVAFKNIFSNGLVLDKNGNKMSKRLGNAVDPFEAIRQYGSDSLRWYMMTNAQPWDNLKFDMQGVDEVKRKFFGTLYNTYSFFALYANIDGFTYSEPEIPLAQRPEIDRWIISLLNTLVKEVKEHYEDYEPTKAGRSIQHFVMENLSNWYVRLNRKRYWGGEYSTDKIAAYQTLYTCLETLVKLAAPMAPFYMDKIFRDLNSVTGKYPEVSVHLTRFPDSNPSMIDSGLEERMEIAQQMSSMILGLRRKVNIKVRQPLQKIMVPLHDNGFEHKFEAVKHLILTEVNVKEAELLSDTSGLLVKKIKPNFKQLGPRYGKLMKEISSAVASFTQEDIQRIESEGSLEIVAGNQNVTLTLSDVEIASEDIPGWLVASEGKITVALDVNLTQELREEGIAREFVNRIQNIRKDSGFEVTDKITIEIQKQSEINSSIQHFGDYICSQTLAKFIRLVDKITAGEGKIIEIDDTITTLILVSKI
jgi:isoleucyl-tRNA synthetase